MFKFITIAIFLISPVCANAQVDNLSMDSIKILLCHKWEFRAVIIGGREMFVTIEDAPIYQFFNDNTLESVSKKKTVKGSWTFDSTRKFIVVRTEKETVYIHKITVEELFLFTDDADSLSQNGEIAFKRIE